MSRSYRRWFRVTADESSQEGVPERGREEEEEDENRREKSLKK